MNKRNHLDIQTDLDNKSNTLKSKKIKTDTTILKQDFINYYSVPSLESIALVNIVAKLWNQPDFRRELGILKFPTEFSYFDTDVHFYEIEKKVSEKVSLLSLPNSLKDKALNIIKPIGLEIIKCINHFEHDDWYFTVLKHDSICWTMQGTIDKAKMLQLHFDSKSLKFIYYGACKYCLEDHIVNLWERMSKGTQDSPFYTKNMYLKYKYHLIAYWTCSIKNELPKLLNMIKPNDYNNVYDCNHSIYKNMFTLSILEGNVFAVKYFWCKLTEGEINNNILEWISLAIERRNKNSNDYTDILCFLLSQMNDKEQQKEVFQKYSHVMLRLLFFGWPWRKFLLPSIQLMWDYLDSKVYIDLLLTVIKEIKEGRIIEKFLKELWCNSPAIFKKHFIQHIINYYEGVLPLLWNLFEIEDIETIKFILNDANVEEKKGFIFSTIRSRALIKLIYTDKLSLLKILIVESLLSECEIKSFKVNIIAKYGVVLCCDWLLDDNLQAIEKFLDWCFNSQVQVDTFKKNILNRIERHDLGILSGGSWSSFERFLSWCFNLVEEINQFKIDVSSSDEMKFIIFYVIIRYYNFEFAEKLLFWCFPSEKEINVFKKELMLSDTGMDMFNRFLSSYKLHETDYSRRELLEKLIEWYYPFEKDVLIEFKEKIKKKYLNFNGLTGNDANLESFFFLLDSFIHGFRDSDWFLNDLELSTHLFELDSSSNTSDDDDNKSQCSSSSNTSDNYSLSQCSSSSIRDDYANLLMGELIDDDYEDIDYNGDIMILDEILDKVEDSK